MTRAKRKDASYTIKELFKKSCQKTGPDQRNKEDDLLLALRLSEQEQVNEQRRLLEQFSQMSQKSIPDATVKKKRFIQSIKEEEDDGNDDDQWFQTVSSRPQPIHQLLKQKKHILESKKRHNDEKETRSRKDLDKRPCKSTTKHAKDAIKTEKNSDDNLLDIDDMSEWLQAKEEPEVEEHLVIDDMSEWLKVKHEDEQGNLEFDDLSEWLKAKDEPEEDNVVIDDMEKQIPKGILIDDEETILPCPICQQLFRQGEPLETHAAMCADRMVVSDSDTDCSVIDLVNNPEATTLGEEATIDPMTFEEEEDGYLSPLEGFTNLKDNRDDQAFGQYFAQLQQAPPKQRRKRTSTSRNTGKSDTTTTRKKKRFYKKKRRIY